MHLYLTSDKNTALRQAYLANATVVTPNPRSHALYARKANLSLLSNSAQLDIDCADRRMLTAIVPQTECIDVDNAPRLWARRKSLFFKPISGHGGKAVYRGDKITKSAWQTVLAGDYSAQTKVPPSLRSTQYGRADVSYKADIRLYTYRGEVLLAAARLYQGQTTNFRTPGGGFAPVYCVQE